MEDFCLKYLKGNTTGIQILLEIHSKLGPDLLLIDTAYFTGEIKLDV